MRNYIFIFFCVVLLNNTNAQDVYQHISKNSIYEFLNETAAQNLIDINTVIYPYSRQFIAEKLVELDSRREQLNSRQQKELDFFFRDYNKELKRNEWDTLYQSQKAFSKKTLFNKTEEKRLDAFFYSSPHFQITVNPVVGFDYLATENVYRRYYGGEVNTYLGKKWAAYFSFRDVSENEEWISPQYFNEIQVGVNRPNRVKKVTDFSEVRGGITYSWKWGTAAIIQDQFKWGNSFRQSNIFAGNFPAIPHIKLNVKPTKWLEFNYIHGWLNSNVVDSVRTYQAANGERLVYHNKFLVANMFTVRPIKHLYVSFGNSTVYSDVGFHPSYFIPFFFYRSSDHALSGQSNRAGQNGQLFFDINTRNIKYFNIYATLFIDEMKFSTFFDKDENRNQLGFKIGVSSYNIAKSNIGIVAEYTRSNPYAYEHGLETITFTQSDYNIGHYLRQNAQEIYLAIHYKPIPKLNCRIYYLNAKKGPEDYGYSNNFGGFSGVPFLERTIYERTEIGLSAQYELIHDLYIKLNLMSSKITDDNKLYAPEFLQGNQFLGRLGVNWNF